MKQRAKHLMILLVLVISGLFLTACGTANNARAQVEQVRPTVGPGDEFTPIPIEGKKPTVVPGDVLTPVPKPPDGRELAILNLQVVSDEAGKLETIRLRNGRIVPGFAPNVFNRPGAWTIELAGNELIRFGIQDPRYVHVYGGRGQDTPHTSIIEREYDWELVVPLYLDSKDLGVEKINIYDQAGVLVFSTTVEDGWREQSE